MISKSIAATGAIAAALSVVLAAQQPPAAPQQPGLTFRAIANYVEVDAIVTDRAGRPVTDLTAADFTVLEDGRPQALNVCAYVDLPIERPDPLLFRRTTAEPDVVTNTQPFDGRVFMIVLDGFHVAPLRTTEVQKQAGLFLERYLGTNDVAAIVHVGDAAAGQEFTSNKRRLLASVARFAGQGLPPAAQNMLAEAKFNAVMAAVGAPAGAAADTEANARAFRARESLSSIRRLSEAMGSLSGRRKALLFFSEGIEYDTTDTPVAVVAGSSGGARAVVNDAASVRSAEQEMIAAATRANVSIYAIDPRGLTSGTADLAAIGSPLVGSAVFPLESMLLDELRLAQDSMRLFADQTGGRAILDQNDMDAAFRRVIEDNSSYYVLGYQSPDPNRNGKFHRVAVKLTRPGLEVRARKGYYAPTDKADQTVARDPVASLLGHPTQAAGLGMRASAGVIKGLMDKSTVHLTVEFSGKDVALADENGVATNDLDVEYLALDARGKPAANWREVVHLRLLPATRAGFLEQGVRYVTEFQILPGRYQLRVAARERVGGRAGSVFYDLDVPDFTALPLAMSDVLITSAQAARVRTGKGASTLGAMLPGPTTTQRMFSPDDTLTAAVRIYDNDADHPHGLDLTATVHADDGAQVFLREEQRAGRDVVGARGGAPYAVSVPLTGMAPGRYILTLEVRSRIGGEPVKKEIEFRIQ
jgi:VWFA-related protein